MEKKILSDSELGKVAGGVGCTVVASGSFTSNTGTQLNLLVNWLVQSDSYGQKTLYVTVSSTSASLQAAALPNTIELTVNGMTYLGTPNAVNYSGSAMATHTLASFAIPNAAGPASLSVAWHFNGVISGVPVGTIWASGVANF